MSSMLHILSYLILYCAVSIDAVKVFNETSGENPIVFEHLTAFMGPRHPDLQAPLIKAKPYDMCTNPQAWNRNSFEGAIVLIDRDFPGCDESTKAYYAERYGAIGVIIGDNTGLNNPYRITLEDQYYTGINIPVVSVTSDSYNELLQLIELDNGKRELIAIINIELADGDINGNQAGCPGVDHPGIIQPDPLTGELHLRDELYVVNMHCLWKIENIDPNCDGAKTVELLFTYFNVETYWDSVYLWDGEVYFGEGISDDIRFVGGWTGGGLTTSPFYEYSVTNTMWIEFYSDYLYAYDAGYDGFSVTYNFTCEAKENELTYYCPAEDEPRVITPADYNTQVEDYYVTEEVNNITTRTYNAESWTYRLVSTQTSTNHSVRFTLPIQTDLGTITLINETWEVTYASMNESMLGPNATLNETLLNTTETMETNSFTTRLNGTLYDVYLLSFTNEQYTNSLDCFWLFNNTMKADNETCPQPIVRVYFTAFHMEPPVMWFGEEFEMDYLTFWDGDSSAYTQIAQMSGTHLWNANDLQSSAEELLVSFHSNEHNWDYIEYDGFNMVVEFLCHLPADNATVSEIICPPIDDPLEVPTDSDIGFITMPTEQYSSNMECGWLVANPQPDTENCTQGVELSFDFFSLEYEYDYIRVYDGDSEDAPQLGTYTGELGEFSVRSSGPSLFLTFISDDLLTLDGFSLSYTWVCVEGVPDGLCPTVDDEPLTPESAMGEIRLTEEHYYGNLECFYHISNTLDFVGVHENCTRTVEVDFTEFDTQFLHDFMRIYDGPNVTSPLLGVWSGAGLDKSPGTIISSGSDLLIKFDTDDRQQGGGFHLTYELLCEHPCEKSHGCPFGTACVESGFNYTCVDLDDCDSSPCKNGGECSDRGLNQYYCDCGTTTYFYGDNCQIQYNPCASDPCNEGGDCYWYEGDANFYCDYDECISEPCENGGICEDLLEGVSCDCTSVQKYGFFCELDFFSCDVSDPCLNGGICEDIGDLEYFCDCSLVEGYEGPICGSEIPDPVYSSTAPYVSSSSSSSISSSSSSSSLSSSSPSTSSSDITSTSSPSSSSSTSSNPIDSTSVPPPPLMTSSSVEIYTTTAVVTIEIDTLDVTVFEASLPDIIDSLDYDVEYTDAEVSVIITEDGEYVLTVVIAWETSSVSESQFSEDLVAALLSESSEDDWGYDAAAIANIGGQTGCALQPHCQNCLEYAGEACGWCEETNTCDSLAVCPVDTCPAITTMPLQVTESFFETPGGIVVIAMIILVALGGLYVMYKRQQLLKEQRGQGPMRRQIVRTSDEYEPSYSSRARGAWGTGLGGQNEFSVSRSGFSVNLEDERMISRVGRSSQSLQYEPSISSRRYESSVSFGPVSTEPQDIELAAVTDKLKSSLGEPNATTVIVHPQHDPDDPSTPPLTPLEAPPNDLPALPDTSNKAKLPPLKF